MALWEALLVYFLILVGAALFGWLPFVLLEHISIVDQIDARSDRIATSSRIVCLACGHANERTYTYCASCGARLPTQKQRGD
ncbi:MAG: hypothetical protein V5A34_02055 [Halapricum sp.]